MRNARGARRPISPPLNSGMIGWQNYGVKPGSPIFRYLFLADAFLLDANRIRFDIVSRAALDQGSELPIVHGGGLFSASIDTAPTAVSIYRDAILIFFAIAPSRIE